MWNNIKYGILLLLTCFIVKGEAYNVVHSNNSLTNQVYRYFEQPYEGESSFFGGYEELSWSNLARQARVTDWYDVTARTIDFSGVDYESIFDRIASPKGLITQFALSLELEAIQTAGWLIAGVVWQFLVGATSGDLQQLLSTFSFLLGPQALMTTILRSLWNRSLEIISRISAAFIIYGFEKTIRDLLTTTIRDIGDFVFNPLIVLLSVGRGALVISFIFAAAPPLYLFATRVWPVIRGASIFGKKKRSLSRSSVEDYIGLPESEGDYFTEFTQTRMYKEWIPEMLESAMTSIIESVGK